MSKSKDDLIVGLIFLGIAGFFGINSRLTLEIGTAGAMGPGYFPLMMSIALGIVGLIIILARSGENGGESGPRPFPWRGMFFVVSAPVAFGLTVRSLGLVPALLITVTLSVLASRKIGFARGAAIVVGMTAFCVAVFSYGIGLTVELVNSRFLP